MLASWTENNCDLSPNRSIDREGFAQNTSNNGASATKVWSLAAATTISMILAGLMGSGALDLILSGGTTELHQNLAILDQFIPPIATFAGVLSIGVIVGGISYVSTYLQKSDNL